MRGVFSVVALLLVLLNGGCAIFEKETTNRGGYLDAVLDDHWMKADSKAMRALRAFAMEVSLARIASVSAKNDSDRQLLAIRIGALTKRFVPIYMCAFNSNPLAVPGAESDPCFYYDSAMVDYSTGLFDLAMIALPIEDGQKLVNTITGSFVNPINIADLLTTLLQIGKDALKYGRVVGALYRDTVELEVQLWLTTPAFDHRPPPYQVTVADITPLYNIYARGNDDMPAWLAEMAALRARGLEPIPQAKFYYELGALMSYICGLITSDSATKASCQANLPSASVNPAPVLGPAVPFRIGDLTRMPGGVRTTPQKSSNTTRVSQAEPMGGALTAVEQVVSLPDGQNFQKALCVAPSSSFDAATRAELKNFNVAFLYPTDSSATDRLTTDADLQNLRAAQRQFPSCKAAGFVSGFEVGLFTRFQPAKVRSDLSEALRVAGLAVPAGFGTAPAKPLIIDDTMRQVIATLAPKYGLSGSRITREFYDKMSASIER